jgi:hypothetical protein
MIYSRGTSYFPCFLDACNYYRPYGYTNDEVRVKISEGEIHLGLPPTELLKEEAYIVDEKPGRRWFIRPAKLEVAKRNFDKALSEWGLAHLTGGETVELQAKRERMLYLYNEAQEQALSDHGTSCGLNGDWSVLAWYFGKGTPNDGTKGIYVIHLEEYDHSVDGDSFAVVRRWSDEDEEDQIVIIESGLTAYGAIHAAIKYDSRMGVAS